MILDQDTVTKLEIEEKVRIVVGRLPDKPKPSGGPLYTDVGSDGTKHSLEAYKQRLFSWLAEAAGDAPREGWQATLYNWCLDKAERVVATPATPVSRQDFKLVF